MSPKCSCFPQETEEIFRCLVRCVLHQQTHSSYKLQFLFHSKLSTLSKLSKAF